jgi:hypothetical protein
VVGLRNSLRLLINPVIGSSLTLTTALAISSTRSGLVCHRRILG